MFKIKLQSEYEDLDKYKNNYNDIWYCKKDTNIVHNPYGHAIIYENGMKDYWIEGKLHRLDGLARTYLNGEGSYYINNKRLSKEQFEKHPERLKYLGKEYLICLG